MHGRKVSNPRTLSSFKCYNQILYWNREMQWQMEEKKQATDSFINLVPFPFSWFEIHRCLIHVIDRQNMIEWKMLAEGKQQKHKRNTLHSNYIWIVRSLHKWWIRLRFSMRIRRGLIVDLPMTEGFCPSTHIHVISFKNIHSRIQLFLYRGVDLTNQRWTFAEPSNWFWDKLVITGHEKTEIVSPKPNFGV